MVEKMDDVLEFAEVIVIGNSAQEFRTILDHVRPDQVVVDLVRIVPNKSEAGRYDGICW
jgi:GDP-mannose 6-dehydrogenase